MVLDPGTAMLIATAVAASAKGAGDYFSSSAEKKAGKRKAKEMERETKADLFSDAMNRNAELEAHKLKSSQKLVKGKSKGFQDTSDLVRGAFNI